MTATLTADELVTTALRRLDMAGLHVGLVMLAIGHDPRYTLQLKDLHDAMEDLVAIRGAVEDWQRLFAEEVDADAS